MSQPRTAINLPLLLGCLLTLSAVGCQSFGPNGYGGYPGNYNQYPVYQPGTVVPYNNGPQGGVILPGNSFSQQPGGFPQPYPQSGLPGGYPPGAAPPFNPAFNPNYSLPPVNRNPGFGSGAQPGIQGADSGDENFGQLGQFPGANDATPAGTRPRMPAEERLSVPDYDDVMIQPGGTTPPVNNTNRRNAPNVDLGPESFQGEINGGKRARDKLEFDDEQTPPTTLIPKKTSMRQQDTDGSTIDFEPPVNKDFTRQKSRNIIQTAQHLEGFPTIRPYGRASNGQAWFRGVVDFDEQDRTWYLIYNPEPDANDERGGIVTLMEHPALQYLKSDDTVLVEGNFNQLETDRYGNAKYQINLVKQLVVPQSAIQ